MGKLSDELRERSKLDNAIIVGSEIRAALSELDAELAAEHDARNAVARHSSRQDDEILRLSAEGKRKDAVIEAAKAYKQTYELCEGGIPIECEAALQEALNALSGSQK